MDNDVQCDNIIRRNRNQPFPQLSNNTKPEPGVLEHDSSESVEGGTDNGGATTIANDRKSESNVNGDILVARSELCKKRY